MAATPEPAHSFRPAWVVLTVLALAPLWALAAGPPQGSLRTGGPLSIPAPQLAEVPIWSQVGPIVIEPPPDPPPRDSARLRPGARRATAEPDPPARPAVRVTLSAPVPAESSAPAAPAADASPGGILLKPPRLAEDPPENDTLLLLTGCKSCGAGGLLDPTAPPPGLFDGGCSGCGGQCIPGRTHECSHCDAQTALGRFCCALYECICCPDPCYEPRWKPLADSAFFVDSARPQTQMGFRWDAGLNLRLPDRSEFFWARNDGNGRGPRPVAPFLAETELRYNTLSLYTEAATGKFGIFTVTPYVSVDPELAPSAANFGDLQVGTKTLLFDCELLQLAFQFKTYIPTGNSLKGLGTGHTSLEPSLILGLKLSKDAYFQAQLCEWIPLGGDPDYAGAVLHYHFSYNQVVWQILPDVPLIATFESNFWSFQDGAFTDPVLGPFQRSSGTTYVSLAPGLRLFICDKIDFGAAAAYSVTDKSWAKQLFRTEVRWRF